MLLLLFQQGVQVSFGVPIQAHGLALTVVYQGKTDYLLVREVHTRLEQHAFFLARVF